MDTIKLVIQLYNDYFGQGYLSWLFLACFVYLWVAEKEKTRRFYLVYITTALLVFFFCPIVAYIAVRTIFDQETYYRILWLLPIYPVIAYAITKLISDCKGKLQKGILMIGGIIVLVTSGVFTYEHPTFTRAENLYHIPQAVIDICDRIDLENDWVYVVVPKELLESMRQYAENIRMPYGREILIERWGFSSELYDIMEADVIDTKLLAEQARMHNCYYVVLREDKVKTERMEAYEYEQVGRVEHYTIYIDKQSIIYPQP